MNIISHTLGFPRIGLNRELKKAQESYWLGNINENELLKVGFNLRKTNWEKQKNAGIDLLPVGDFAWYDHVLTTSLLLGNIPLRHQNKNKKINLDTIFLIGRGQDNTGKTSKASEMTKWFNTNYHYIVPEFIKNQKFELMWTQLLDEIDEALNLGFNVKPILIGPITYLWLGKIRSINSFNKLSLLNELIPVYQQILIKLSKKGIKWIQIDEPILSLELSDEWIKSFQSTYNLLQSDVKILLTTYFDSINQNYNMICSLPIQGLHVDLACGKNNIYQINKKIPKDWVLSLGIIDGRNIWRANLIEMFHYLQPLTYCREHIWIGSSCSLMHCPIDLNKEKKLDNELKSWFSFALQKCHEILLLSDALKNNNDYELKLWSIPIINRKNSNRIHDIFVQKRIKNINKKYYNRKSKYLTRSLTQRLRFNLPIFPTTTIGSFPQTKEIRSLRLDFKQGKINKNEYCNYIKKHISQIIFEQEKIDLDVLVHGEPERNDMVEYFSEHLNGFVVTENGWVQSYGSRCVKPPIIFSDISRSKPITIEWIKYAQSLTKKPVKGMLTGPVTILCWSFLRDDVSREYISKQIALAIRDEVHDLEKSGISIIQIDEPALREGLPLHKSDWIDYFKWATDAFRLSSSVVSDETQIHTHMCYSSFNDIMDAIIKLDVDVITIESSRSDMEVLKTFKKFNYQNEIGPGIYDIHSPNIPNTESIEYLLNKAIQIIPKNRLWVNPDCGLKTRSWKEIRQSLKNMVKAVQNYRKIFIK